MHSLLNSSRHSNSLKSNGSSTKQNTKLKPIIQSNDPTKGSLYICGIQGAIDLLAIKKQRIGCILSCEKGYLLNHPSELVSDYKYLPLDLDLKTSLNQLFVEAIEFIKSELKKTNVLVHCLTGVNKSVGIILAYNIKQFQMTLDQSIKTIQKIVKIKIQDKLLKALKQFEKIQRKQSYLQNSIKESFLLSNNKSRLGIKSNSKHQSTIMQNPQNQISFASKKQKSQSLSKQDSINYNHFYHTEPKNFQMIYSSKHYKYIGVKRQQKNCRLHEDRQNNNSRKNSCNDIELKSSLMIQCDKKDANLKLNKPQFRRSLSTNQVLIAKDNSFLQVQNNRQLKTQKSRNERTKSQSSNIFQEEVKNTKENTQQNNQFQFQNLSPSRILYFSDVNKNLNTIISSIQNQYEKQANYMRIKYTQKMGSLKEEIKKLQNPQNTQNTQNPESPYSKIKTKNLFSQHTEQNPRYLDCGFNQGIDLKLNGRHQITVGRENIFEPYQ